MLEPISDDTLVVWAQHYSPDDSTTLNVPQIEIADLVMFCNPQAATLPDSLLRKHVILNAYGNVVPVEVDSTHTAVISGEITVKEKLRLRRITWRR